MVLSDNRQVGKTPYFCKKSVPCEGPETLRPHPPYVRTAKPHKTMKKTPIALFLLSVGLLAGCKAEHRDENPKEKPQRPVVALRLSSDTISLPEEWERYTSDKGGTDTIRILSGNGSYTVTYDNELSFPIYGDQIKTKVEILGDSIIVVHTKAPNVAYDEKAEACFCHDTYCIQDQSDKQVLIGIRSGHGVI